ncbi:MAG: hypothetical protein QM308_00895 [Bacillota bacterium]|nr:hypothetical protein [Bacillota bacterium]
MKRILIALLLLCLLMPGALAQESAKKEPLTLRVYLYDPCGGCASADAGCRDCAVITQVLDRLIIQNRALYDEGALIIKVRNLMYETVYKEYQGYLKGFGLSEDVLRNPPLYLVGEPGWGKALSGEANEGQLPGLIEEVLNSMPEDAAWRRPVKEGQTLLAPRSDSKNDILPTDSLILYFFKDYCPYCKDLEPLFLSLPESVTLPDGTVSRVRFISLEKQLPREMQVVQKYYDKLFVHPDRQYVPMIVIGSKALFLQEEIEPGLMPALLAGEGLQTDREPLRLLED